MAFNTHFTRLKKKDSKFNRQQRKKMSLTRLGLHKTAGSDLWLTDHQKKNKISPDQSYHYYAQGKYTYPILNMKDPPKGIKNVGKSGIQHFIGPDKAQKYIQEYEGSVLTGITNTIGRATKTKERKKFLGLIPYNKTVKKVKADPEELRGILNSENFKTNHKKVVDYMKANAEKGFHVEVG